MFLFPFLQYLIDHLPISLFAEVLHDGTHRLHFVLIFGEIYVFLDPGNDLFAGSHLGQIEFKDAEIFRRFFFFGLQNNTLGFYQPLDNSDDIIVGNLFALFGSRRFFAAFQGNGYRQLGKLGHNLSHCASGRYIFIEHGVFKIRFQFI